jgi:hypothetical protein
MATALRSDIRESILDAIGGTPLVRLDQGPPPAWPSPRA